MKAKEIAKIIRREIKAKLGYSAKQVSVRIGGGSYSSSINIDVKSLDIPLEPIEKIAENYEKYERDENTQEILSGGNLFVLTQYHWKLKYE